MCHVREEEGKIRFLSAAIITDSSRDYKVGRC